MPKPYILRDITIPPPTHTNNAFMFPSTMKGSPPSLQKTTQVHSGNNDSKSAIADAAAITCSGGDARFHFACLPKKARSLIAFGQEPWYQNSEEAQRAKILAEIAAGGRLRAGSPDAALHLSFQLIHAASASGSPTRGEALNYTPEQKEELRRVLSAALQVLHASYRPTPDSRTGCDLLPWLLRGAVIGHGLSISDFSTTYVAVLFAGSTVAGVALLRPLSDGVAEMPVFTIRPELRRNGLGEVLLSAVEKSLDKAGFELIYTPAMAVPGWPLTPSLAPNDHQLPAPTQSMWGYTLSTREDMQKYARRRPITFPGASFCVKRLSVEGGGGDGGVDSMQGGLAAGPLNPRSLPTHALKIAPEIDVVALQKRGLITFRVGDRSGPEMQMTGHPGEELVIKPAPALVHHQYRQVPGGTDGGAHAVSEEVEAGGDDDGSEYEMDDDYNDDDYEASLRRGYKGKKNKGKGRKRGRPPGSGGGLKKNVNGSGDGDGGGSGAKRGRPRKIKEVAPQAGDAMNASAIPILPSQVLPMTILPMMPVMPSIGVGVDPFLASPTRMMKVNGGGLEGMRVPASTIHTFQQILQDQEKVAMQMYDMHQGYGRYHVPQPPPPSPPPL